MKYIEKREPPKSLEEYKLSEGASFDDLSDNHSRIKREIKNSLMAEQGYICCYCGKRIDRNNSVIEHFLPKDDEKFPQLQLEYSNLLASCNGGNQERAKNIKYQGKKFPLSCDNKKGNRVIGVCPTNPNCESYFEYDEDGGIYGINDKANWAIKILGLDNEFLKNQRKAAIDAYKDLPEDTDWQYEINCLSSLNRDGQYEPYCFAVIYYIKHYKLFAIAA